MNYVRYLRQFVGTRPIILTGVTVIVRNELGQYLLQKRTDSFDWGTLGGSLELGESLEEAARRELYEEAGLQADDLIFKALLSGKDMYYVYPHGDEIYNVIAVFEAVGIHGLPTINDDEGLELRYFSIDEPIENLNPMTLKILKKAGYLSYKGHLLLKYFKDGRDFT
jgi:8-oxo-dGTP pyrophosphatase MutT (NUDIX family)